MRIHSLGLALLLTLSMTGAALAAGLTIDNVIGMHKSGLPAPVIVQTLQSTNSSFNLTVQDLAKLEQAGVPKAVIEVMMGAGGEAAPPPPPAPEPAPEPAGEGEDELKKLQESEAVERAKIEEEARIRAAVKAAADKERKRIASENKLKIAQALSAAREALKDERYAEAAKLFSEFLDSSEQAGNSKTTAHASAKLGLAEALHKLGLYGNAAELYHQLLDFGADSDVFVPAFIGLRDCSKQISYSPVTLEGLTNHFIGNAPQKVQDSYNYFLGKFFFDYNRSDEALKYLSAVKPGSDDYADAQYIQGLVMIQLAGDDEESEDWAKNIIGASGAFQNAVIAASENNIPRIRDLAYMALARIAYTLSSFDAAIFYYRKIPSDSTSYVDALHEAGWSYFLKGDTKRGMGIFHTLDGPDWKNFFLPDTYLLEATVFMNKCHFEFAYDAITRLEKHYLALRKPLTQFIETYTLPEEIYNAFVLDQYKENVQIPHLLRMAVISNTEFYDLYVTVTKYRRELAKIRDRSGEMGEALTRKLIDAVETRHHENRIALGIKISELLQGLSESLENLDIQVTEIRIEIDEVKAEELAKQVDELAQGKQEEADVAAAQKRASIFVGDKYITWGFEGEYWSDEINNYRSNLEDVCK